ncbi:ribosomal protein S18 acetylase RimI-like enzyme [Rhizobium skierniewicense]|uniref:Ribosomal protein S18 acetylase RimI-like enzyme n=1 Tax=Rhizobium skierniewicense TaxID=984260 RepID=A0A7W6G214_9HYPH|nr:GNAT family N-acetyltransferase [Rhizobium skierniewicense]MBB3945979.1 ribosomal protein S18 acetylase RimI-like enzyme [Rhizobium skierniewicense]
MHFRPARADDAASLAAISVEVWIGTYVRKGVNSVFAEYALSEFTAAKFEAFLASENEAVIVSQNENGIDGFIRLSFDSPAPDCDRCATEICTLYVQPRHHGRKLGSGLLHEALRLCQARDISEVWLAVNSQNTRAIEFYKAHSFSLSGQTHFRIADEVYLNEVMKRRTV